MPPRTSLALLILTVTAAAGLAQSELKNRSLPGEGVTGGSITDGVNLWEITGPSGNEGVFTDLEVPIGSDHQYASWWWYRVAGDTAETILPLPDTENYSGALATLTWTDVDGRGLFSAELNVLLVAQGPGGALLSALEVTNISGASLELAVFAYNDMDMDGSAAQDSAIEVSPRQIDVFETTRANFLGNQADDYLVASFPGVRGALNDEDIDDFDSSGVPFGPGDFSGGYQWSRALLAGDSALFETLICVDTGEQCPGFFVVFEDGFESGDTGRWDSTVP